VLQPSLLAALVDLAITPPWWGAAADREFEDAPWGVGDGTTDDGVLCAQAGEEARGENGARGQGAGEREESDSEGGLRSWLCKRGVVHAVGAGLDAGLGCQSLKSRHAGAGWEKDGVGGDAVVRLGAGAHFLPRRAGGGGEGRALLCARGRVHILGVDNLPPGGGQGGGESGHGAGGRGGNDGGASGACPLAGAGGGERGLVDAAQVLGTTRLAAASSGVWRNVCFLAESQEFRAGAEALPHVADGQAWILQRPL